MNTVSNWCDIYFKVKELADLMSVEAAPMRKVAKAIAEQCSDQALPTYERKEQHATAIIETVLQLANEWKVPLALAQQIAVGEAYRYTQANYFGLLQHAPAQTATSGS